jgi:hypothetical protein
MRPNVDIVVEPMSLESRVGVTVGLNTVFPGSRTCCTTDDIVLTKSVLSVLAVTGVEPWDVLVKAVLEVLSTDKDTGVKRRIGQEHTVVVAE